MPAFHYRQEVFRKLLHLSSLWMPVAIYFLEKETALSVFAAGAVAVLAYEAVRRHDHGLAKILNRLLGAALRPDEKEISFKPSGAVYVLAAAFLTTLLFPRLIAITALSMMLTGDAAAALVGSRFGKKAVLGKSLEGALAFFVTALATAGAVAALMPVSAGYMQAALAAAFAAAVTELVSNKIRINDNLSVPLAAGAVMLLLL